MSEKNNNTATTTEEFIPLIYERPEIWNQFCPDYMNKSLKAQSWTEISSILGVPEKRAKLRWTNLRDFFRREMKKVIRKASETGDPDAYVPKWKNFHSMMFLKDNVIRTMNSNMPDQDSYAVYPQAAIGDGEMSGEDEYFDEEGSNSSLQNGEPDFEVEMSPNVRTKRTSDMNGYVPRKKPCRSREVESNDFAEDSCSRSNGQQSETVQQNENGRDIKFHPVPSYVGENKMEDSDYHFIMSMLPSFRRIREDRKTSFRVKVLNLILEEEKHYV